MTYLEFLMTYGLVILIILIVAGVLAYYGIFLPSGFLKSLPPEPYPSMPSQIIDFMKSNNCSGLYIWYDGRLACQYTHCIADYCKYDYKFFVIP